ncbi:helix-turn-helix domain-containing protein [Negativibacillus massiliensis]|uniref:helix-turn-helix domain-containing protein n=1 Tax=Negativibacillus massiliensis TaxID=1871035 RepID=UPI000339E2EE|nr:helix-turn-helix transcriptional regulator [Negativibacillus massiliensis]CDA75351.1 helix-turn-helix [Clostridium sp. CAG:242]
MEKYFIGEIIRQKRTELGLKQCQLCEGICEPTTMSRIESGKQMPGLNTLKNLLQRLGLSDERYYALVSKNEMQIADLQTEIVSANVFKDPQRGLPKIAELEELADPDDHLLHQFILRSKVLLGKKENEQIIPYTYEEKLDMLFKAIRLTVPNFDIDAIADGLYSIDEAKVINQIALVYSNHGENQKAIHIYDQLLQYIKKHFQNILQSGGLLPLVAFNYARELDLIGRYTDAIEIAETGWKACTQYGQYRMLAPTIALIAECNHFLGDDSKNKEYYRQSYYIYKAVDDERGARVITAEAKKYFGEDFSF